MSYWDYLPYCIAVAAVLYYLWTQKDNTAIVMDPPNLEFGYPQPAHVLRYEGEELITESTRKELVHYFAKTAYDWHASKWKDQQNLLGHLSRQFVEICGMAADYCENLLREMTNNEALRVQIDVKIRMIDEIATEVLRVIEDVRLDGGVDLEGELWATDDLKDLEMARDHYNFIWDELARAGLRLK